MNINILTTVDTPTISNALDLYRGDRSADGFTKFPVVCSNKNLTPIIGVAKTAKTKFFLVITKITFTNCKSKIEK